MKRLAIAAVPLLAVSWTPLSASAEEVGTILATAAGVVAGGIVASAVVAGTTATIVGAAIGGSIACWWYDDADASGIEALPRKAAVQGAPANGVTLIAASELRIVPAKR